MDSIVVFGNNFKIIRLAHGLTMNDMAALLGFKQTGAISLIESGKRQTSMDVLRYITVLFSVSLDWLLGYNSNVYNIEFMNKKENMIFHVPVGKGKCFIDIAPDVYKNASTRENVYTIKERANILFLVYYIDSLIGKSPELQLDDTNLNPIESITKKGMEFFEGLRNINKKHYKTTEAEYEYAYNSLAELLNPDIRTYIDDNNELKHIEKEMCLFDIEKQIYDLTRTY